MNEQSDTAEDKNLATQAGSYYAYEVQVCCSHINRSTVASNGQIITPEWSRVDVSSTAQGIPNDDYIGLAFQHGYMSYHTAQSHSSLVLSSEPPPIL